MTVKELIEKLNALPQNAIVVDDRLYWIRSAVFDSKMVIISRTNYEDDENDK